MHYVTTTYLNESVQTFHDPPLMFHIDHDPGESFPLDPNDPAYISARANIEKHVVEHERTLESVPNQIALGNDPKLAICCDRKASGAGKATCNCNPDNMNVFVCDGKNQFDDGGVMPMPHPNCVDSKALECQI